MGSLQQGLARMKTLLVLAVFVCGLQVISDWHGVSAAGNHAIQEARNIVDQAEIHTIEKREAKKNDSRKKKKLGKKDKKGKKKGGSAKKAKRTKKKGGSAKKAKRTKKKEAQKKKKKKKKS